MLIAAVPLVAGVGALVGVLLHETTHAVAAIAVGELVAVGWRGGLTMGGPVVDFRAPSRWRSEVVRKAPLALGGLALVAAVVTYSEPTLPWLFGAGVTLGLLATSPEDLFLAAAERDG